MATGKLVFVSYSHEDQHRVRPLVDLLDRKLRDIDAAIFWDPQLRIGAPLSTAIQTLLWEAVCVLVVWTARSVSSQWVHGEAKVALESGRIVPVLLDKEAQIPPPFNARSHANLFDWAGDESPDFQGIWASVRELVQRGSKPRTSVNEWVIQDVVYASSELRSLAGRFRSINEVLLANSLAVQDLRDALEEVMNTYRVVMKGIQQFTKSAVKPGPFNGEPYAELAWSDLPQEIERGRGHCGNILILYNRYNGVRDAIKDRLAPDQMKEVDDTFTQLGTADGDAFLRMTRIGEYLRDESRAIVNSMFARQEDAARQRVADTLKLLDPLEQELSSAMKEMQQLQASLGHAGSRQP